MSDEGWEARMAARHKARAAEGIAARRRAYLGEVFLKFWPLEAADWLEPQAEILPEIIAARCLGITYGDPGPRLPADTCRKCWGERHVWLGNTWGQKHVGDGDPVRCKHSCHAGEVWLASA